MTDTKLIRSLLEFPDDLERYFVDMAEIYLDPASFNDDGEVVRK